MKPTSWKTKNRGKVNDLKIAEAELKGKIEREVERMAA